MAKKLTVETDQYGQTYGTYRLNKELGKGSYILSKQSPRKWYPDVLCRTRSEDCILDAIANYKAEIKAKHAEIAQRNS